MSEQQVGDAVPVAQRGSWTAFIKSMASFSGDLYSMTAPPFILSPVSLTEYPSYWCEHPELFAAIADQITPEERALAVLKWFVSTLKGQYTSRNESMGSEKKPLNPVLGELFYGKWPNKDNRGETSLLVEQVSHHPPITAYVIENKAKGVKLVGHNAQKTTFSGGSIIVKQIGHANLTVKLPSGETAEYIITLPRLRIDGLWYGSPYIELAETSSIVSSDFISTVEYKGKGYFSGKSHSFKATLTPSGLTSTGHHKSDKNNELHRIEGTWHTTSEYTAGPRKGKEFHNVNGAKEIVEPVGGEASGEMGEFETRKLWNLVAKGIREGDFDAASKEKTKIENEQRQRRKDEQAAATTWPKKHFEHVPNDPLYQSLAKLANLSPATEDYYVFKDNWPASN